MKYIYVVFLIALIQYSCGFDKQGDNVGLSFSIDMNQLKRTIGASSSAVQSSSGSIASLNSAATAINSNDELMFFGVVLRQVDGAGVIDASGNPVGNIIPNASRIYNIWQDPVKFQEINSGRVTVTAEVPTPSQLSVTFYGIFIEENEYEDGPGKWTSIYHVAGPFSVEGAEATINVKVDGEIVVDDHKDFLNWASFFADGSGTPLGGTEINLRHCKIGFEFKQSMFDDNMGEDKYLFRTNAYGAIDSVMPSGVDWELSVGGNILKPCGGGVFSANNYTYGSGGVLFTAFVGNEMFTDPSLFVADARITGNNFGIANDPFGDTSVDHDGDGLPTFVELDELKTNPFMKDEVFHQYFSGRLVHFRDAVENGTSVDVRYEADTTNATGSCTAGYLYYWNGSTWASAGNASIENSSSGYESCLVSIGEGTFAGMVGPNSVSRIILKIQTGFEADIDGDTVNDALNLYVAFNWCNGTGCTQAASFTGAKLYKRYYNTDGPGDEIATVSNLSTLYPSSCDSNFNYMWSFTGSGFQSGGYTYLSSLSDCSGTAYSYTEFHEYFSEDTLYQLEMNQWENSDSGDLYLCHKLALNSNTGNLVMASPIHFIVDPNYSCSSGTSISTIYFGTVTESSLLGNIGPSLDIYFDGEIGIGANTVLFNFTGGYSLCLDGMTVNPTDTSIYIPGSTTVVSHSLPGVGTWAFSDMELYTTSDCTGTAVETFTSPGGVNLEVY